MYVCWVLCAGEPLTVSDIVTRWPPGTAATDTTRFVTMLCALLTWETVWYTQVLPTAMGNGIDPADTNEFEVALGVAPVPAVAEGDPPDAVLPDAVLPAAAPDVLTDAPHPASAITAAPASTTRANLYLLMSMPRSVKSALWSRVCRRTRSPPCRKHALRVGPASPGGVPNPAKGPSRIPALRIAIGPLSAPPGPGPCHLVCKRLRLLCLVRCTSSPCGSRRRRR